MLSQQTNKKTAEEGKNVKKKQSNDAHKKKIQEKQKQAKEAT